MSVVFLTLGPRGAWGLLGHLEELVQRAADENQWEAAVVRSSYIAKT